MSPHRKTCLEKGEKSNGCACGTTPRNPTRRTILQALTAAIFAFGCWPRRAWAKKVAIILDQAPQLKQVGGWAILKVKDRNILFIRDSEDTVKALDPVCTHQHNLVKYSSQYLRIVCPVHGSQYNLNGKVLKGPATMPLSPVYEAKLERQNNRIVIKL